MFQLNCTCPNYIFQQIYKTNLKLVKSGYFILEGKEKGHCCASQNEELDVQHSLQSRRIYIPLQKFRQGLIQIPVSTKQFSQTMRCWHIWWLLHMGRFLILVTELLHHIIHFNSFSQSTRKGKISHLLNTIKNASMQLSL